MSYDIEFGRFINLPLKRTTDINLVDPMKTFASNNMNKSDEDLIKNIRDFDLMRKTALVKTLDKHESSLQVLYQYYDQFNSVNKKMPFCEAVGVNATFTWKSSVEKSKSFLSTTPKLGIANGDFEKLCVLFNIASLMSQIASDANLKTDEGLKAAAKYFQESSGIFEHIKDRIMSVVGVQSVTCDLNPSTLHSFSLLMVAQSQECFFIKAAEMNQKPKILAKVAAQVAAYYKDAEASINSGEKLSVLSQIAEQCELKKTYYKCQAEYHESKALVESGTYGEAVARLKKIEPVMKLLLKNQSTSVIGNDLKQFNAVYNADKKQIEKDNSFIYLEIVPKIENLAAINGAVIAKPKAFNEQERLSPKFHDLFTSLMPLPVHVALQSFDGKRKDLVERQIERLREKNNLLNGVMSSLNLPASLEDVNSTSGSLPASIIEKSQIVCSKGGVGHIDHLLKELPESLERNQQILLESLRMLDDEQASDDELRNKFGDKWKRKPSSELTVPLRKDAAKYQAIVENAKKADGIVREKYMKSREGIELLGLPEAELKQKVPSASSLANLKDNSVVVELKMLCEKVESMKAVREVIENELKVTSFDMTEKFLQALADDGTIDEESITPRELDVIYQPMIAQVDETIGEQESLLANIQRASEQFSVLKQQSSGMNRREEVLKKMAAAFDGFEELVRLLEEGSKFYQDLTELLLKLQSKCSDLVFARKTEKDDLMGDLQQGIIGSSESTAPQVPSYHEEARNQPPARPPPPMIPPTTPSTPSAPSAAPSAPSAAPSAPPAAPTPAPRYDLLLQLVVAWFGF